MADDRSMGNGHERERKSARRPKGIDKNMLRMIRERSIEKRELNHLADSFCVRWPFWANKWFHLALPCN
jgi:hypothetical protein